MKARILVTGGTGYIGSHTAVELLENGYEVLIIDNLSNSRLDVLDGIEAIAGRRPDFEQLDLCDRRALGDCLSRYPDLRAVIHFAAYKAVGESVEKPLMYYENNLLSLLNLLNEMESHGILHFVFSSSCTVYGQPDTLPVTEDSPIKRANSPYGNTKQISEEIIQDAILAGSAIRAISLRYFNPIGAHPSALIGELPIGIPNNLVPFITQTAFGLHPELKVFGNDFNTPDGYGIRDYIDVVDLSRAHVVAIDRLSGEQNAEPLEVFNLGTGQGLSVMQMIRAFEQATGVELNYRVVDRREGDVEQVWADTRRANEVLGWKAGIPLEETLRHAWDWEQYIRNKLKSEA